MLKSKPPVPNNPCFGIPISQLLTMGYRLLSIVSQCLPSRGLNHDCEIFAKLRLKLQCEVLWWVNDNILSVCAVSVRGRTLNTGQSRDLTILTKINYHRKLRTSVKSVKINPQHFCQKQPKAGHFDFLKPFGIHWEASMRQRRKNSQRSLTKCKHKRFHSHPFGMKKLFDAAIQIQ